MSRPLRAACLALACVAGAGCVARRAPAVPAVEALAALLEGRFSSAAQAERDPDYRDIRLAMARIWRERPDGPWLYVEQAVTGAAPYRQRVYHLIGRADGSVESAVYTLPDPAAFAGAQSDPARFGTLAPEGLVPRTGCSVFLSRRADGKFEGGTRGKECPSDLRGAAYATSEAVIGPAGMTSWDRGYDAAGAQVWGAEKGGYEFLRER
jgi:hypothetical protein